ncbi:hypothetical protein E5358_04375 [Palleniella muris]|uniref:Uncharacterized protein n=1 Tax=Palleniella muris TaxID=3038145 RepID=A0AC61QSE9_9BACT|nr:hypothetical protein [Palleniella muris]TGX83184.1 hypothetical protein E5358_04375 [Palleniella muris]
MNITDKELKYMIECAMRDLTEMLVEKRQMTVKEALRTLYTSDTLKALKMPATGLYHQSSQYIYSFLDNEITTARMA